MNDFIDLIRRLFDPKFPDETWRKVFLFIPRKSINGKLLWGSSWMKDGLIPYAGNDPLMTHTVIQLYASNKEYFVDKLSNANH